MEGEKGEPDPAPELRVTETANRGMCPACPMLVAPVQKQPRDWTAAAMQGWGDHPSTVSPGTSQVESLRSCLTA